MVQSRVFSATKPDEYLLCNQRLDALIFDDSTIPAEVRLAFRFRMMVKEQSFLSVKRFTYTLKYPSTSLQSANEV